MDSALGQEDLIQALFPFTASINGFDNLGGSDLEAAGELDELSRLTFRAPRSTPPT